MNPAAHSAQIRMTASNTTLVRGQKGLAQPVTIHKNQRPQLGGNIAIGVARPHTLF